jgi:hypothetical protein
MTGFPFDPGLGLEERSEFREDPDHPGRKDLIIFFAPLNGLTVQQVSKNFQGRGRGDSDYTEVVTIGETNFLR